MEPTKTDLAADNSRLSVDLTKALLERDEMMAFVASFLENISDWKADAVVAYGFEALRDDAIALLNR